MAMLLLLIAAAPPKYTTFADLVWTNAAGIISPITGTKSVQFNANANKGVLFLGTNSQPFWGSPGNGGEAFICNRDTAKGDPNFIEMWLGVTDGAASMSYDLFGTKTSVNLNQKVGANSELNTALTTTSSSLLLRTGGGDREISLISDANKVLFSQKFGGTVLVELKPAVASTTTPFYFDTAVTHTSGELFELYNNSIGGDGIRRFRVGYDGAVQALGPATFSSITTTGSVTGSSGTFSNLTGDSIISSNGISIFPPTPTPSLLQFYETNQSKFTAIQGPDSIQTNNITRFQSNALPGVWISRRFGASATLATNDIVPVELPADATKFLNGTGAFSGASSTLAGNTLNVLVAANTTNFMPVITGLSSLASSDSSGGTRNVLPYNCLLTNIYFVSSSTQGAGKTITWTLMTNGVASSIVINILNGLTGNDLTHGVVVQAGWEIGWRQVSTNGLTSSKYGWGIESIKQ